MKVPTALSFSCTSPSATLLVRAFCMLCCEYSMHQLMGMLVKHAAQCRSGPVLMQSPVSVAMLDTQHWVRAIA